MLIFLDLQQILSVLVSEMDLPHCEMATQDYHQAEKSWASLVPDSVALESEGLALMLEYWK